MKRAPILVLIAWAFRASLTTFAHPPEGALFHLPAFLAFLLSSLMAVVAPVLLPALLYFANLCVNCVEAFALKADKPVSRFAWGLLLFIGCDVCVGAWNLALFGDFALVGMWFFYLPSQVLIVLSQCLEGDIQ